MGYIYYKNVKPGCIIFFFVNQNTMLIDGVFSEIRLKDIISIRRKSALTGYGRVDKDEKAIAFIKASKQISYEEYKYSKLMLDAFMDSEYWLLSEEPMSNVDKEEVTETVYC